MLNPTLGPISLALAVIFGIYLAYEVWRWFAGNAGDLTRGQFVRRVVGGLFLETTLLMWALANPLMTSRPLPERLLYLLFSVLLALLSMLLAVREAGFVVRQYHRSRRELIQSLARQDARKETPNGP